MGDQRSVQSYEHWRDANQRFDYFIMGTTGALCAFIAQSWVPTRISFCPSTAELVALLLLAGSVIAGFKRSQNTVQTFALAHKNLELAEWRGELAANLSGGPLLNRSSGDVISHESALQLIDMWGKMIPQLESAAQEEADAAGTWAGLRNWLLALGFLLLLGARVWSAYV